MKPCVLVAVEDLFFSSKIIETAKHLGIPLQFARSQDEVIARALTEKPVLFIVDLNSTRCNPLETIGQLKEDPDLRHIPVVGFLSHIQADLKVKATMAGCDRVLPRSVFTTHLPKILAEYSTSA